MPRNSGTGNIPCQVPPTRCMRVHGAGWPKATDAPTRCTSSLDARTPTTVTDAVRPSVTTPGFTETQGPPSTASAATTGASMIEDFHFPSAVTPRVALSRSSERGDPLDHELEEPVRVDVDPHLGIRGPAGRAPEVDDRAAVTEPGCPRDLDVHVPRRHE